MTIGILTTFYRFDPGYSLCSVVRDQLEGAVRSGYKTVLFTLPQFADDHLIPAGVEIRKVVPQIILEPYKDYGYPDHWKEDVAKVKKAFEEHMGDIDHLICHDIFFIDTFLPYNIALRESNVSCRLYCWTHSAPSARPSLVDNIHANRFTLPPRSVLVYLNHDRANDLAEMYGAWLKDVRVVHNARDPRTAHDLHPLVSRVVEDTRLLGADIVSTYPLSTPRMIAGKGLDKVIKLHAKLKELGYETRLVVPNAHANGQAEKRLISETKVWASSLGLSPHDVVFTSTYGEEWELGVPPKVVSDLFRLSNVFIFPTSSENSSLVLLEAMLAGNLLVLNSSVGTLREHAGLSAIYMDFSYREPKEENERYYLDLAKIVASQFEASKPLQAKRTAFKKHNIETVFKKEIEPLFYEHRD